MDTPTYRNPGDLKSPIFTPRPGWGACSKAWLGRNWLKALAVVAVLAVGTAILVDRLDKDDEDTVATTTATPMPTPKGSVSGSSTERYSYSTAAGQGITHLARMAVGSYLTSNRNTSIVSEQRVFAEDYLKDRKVEERGSRWLSIGDVITFEVADVKAAINAALMLTAEQIRGLAKWAHLVVGF
jgi:hypothetical protein